MRRFSWLASVLVALAAHSAERYSIVYKFDGEKGPVSYDVSVDMKTESTASFGKRREESTTHTVLRFTMELKNKGAGEGGGCAHAVSFKDVTADQEITGPSGEVKVRFSKGNLLVTKGGEVVVDTGKGKGTSLAAALMREFAFLGSEGTVELDPDGRITKVSGSKEFEAFLAGETAGTGLFPLVCPRDKKKVGESWTAGPFRVASLKGLDLSANPLPVEITYKLEGVEEADGGRRAEVSLRADLSRRDLSATARSEALGEQEVTVAGLERKAKGTVHFDLERGRVRETSLEAELSVRTEMDFEGKTVTTTFTGRAKVETKLSGAPEAKEPQGEEAEGAK